MFTQQQQLDTRAKVAVAGGVLLLLIGAMGVMMGWSLYFKTFSSYPWFFQNLFAFGTAFILDASLFWYGVQLIKAAATWGERICAMVSAVFILGVIGLNIATHNAITRGVRLVPWQADYINYFGPAVIAIIALLIMVQLVLRPEVQRAFKDAMRDFQTKERLNSIEDKALASPEFDQWMSDNFKQDMYRRAASRAGYDPSRHTVFSASPPPAISGATTGADLIEGEEQNRGYLNGPAPRP